MWVRRAQDRSSRSDIAMNASVVASYWTRRKRGQLCGTGAVNRFPTFVPSGPPRCERCSGGRPYGVGDRVGVAVLRGSAWWSARRKYVISPSTATERNILPWRDSMQSNASVVMKATRIVRRALIVVAGRPLLSPPVPASAGEVLRYWTTDRMAAAEPESSSSAQVLISEPGVEGVLHQGRAQHLVLVGRRDRAEQESGVDGGALCLRCGQRDVRARLQLRGRQRRALRPVACPPGANGISPTATCSPSRAATVADT